MKVVFLDMDGVLNGPEGLQAAFDSGHPRESFGWWRSMTNDDMIARVNRITEATGAKIIWSSTWRESFPVFKEGANFLSLIGLKAEVVDYTPMVRGGFGSSMYMPRGKEILAWLKENDVENYVILDDQVWVKDPDHHPHVVQTQERVGLLDEHVEEAIEILNS